MEMWIPCPHWLRLQSPVPIPQASGIPASSSLKYFAANISSRTQSIDARTLTLAA
ncbi:hypothetical protein OpiT1DRAFT_05458 [Opitutaceae bacterium TAV1]|nr:hypothetical protein OpiT1DRAFT_05458 [Opitutaceae bacterium TAV1]